MADRWSGGCKKVRWRRKQAKIEGNFLFSPSLAGARVENQSQTAIYNGAADSLDIETQIGSAQKLKS